ncbi:Holliday junction endonuclease RuvC [Brevinema andersonii]|uniref:Crossover junction endodeoxyribonuclease RuvC n=1 Tax=Brevinema andersonii TaxID=34097 RepID=A0A1I1EIK4_BREAD|nr:crossover junction endodeoxyribonuclease RuvC [Brevinema andersonii]SFB86877.1 Holliday junction endonuclease RuvC [Brevinema andersonii]
MVICGIDPGFDRAGYAFLQNIGASQPVVLSYGVVTTDKSHDFSMRLFELAEDFVGLFERYQPQYLVLEKLFMGRNITTALPVAEIRGVLRYLAAKNNIELTEVPPNTVKKNVTGYGGADKKQIIQAVTFLLNLPYPPQPDDAADALAIAFCGFLKF